MHLHERKGRKNACASKERKEGCFCASASGMKGEEGRCICASASAHQHLHPDEREGEFPLLNFNRQYQTERIWPKERENPRRREQKEYDQ